MNYQELKKSHADRINDFPICFAFSNEQFDDVLTTLGPAETLLSIGSGGFIRKADQAKFYRLFELSESEMKAAMENDEFLEGAIVYELGNHEYGYTGDPSDTIEVLDLDLNDDRVKRIFAKAKSVYLAGCEF